MWLWGKNRFWINLTIFIHLPFERHHLKINIFLLLYIVCCSTKSQTWLITRYCWRHCLRQIRVQGVSKQQFCGPVTITLAKSPDRDWNHPPEWPLGALRFQLRKSLKKKTIVLPKEIQVFIWHMCGICISMLKLYSLGKLIPMICRLMHTFLLVHH